MAGKVRVVGDGDVITEPRAPRKRRGATARTASEDMLIQRPDLGRGATTLVGKGDPIPPEARPYLT